MKILFDVAQLYYLPQYLPVWQELEHRNVNCLFIFYGNNGNEDSLKHVIDLEKIPANWVYSDRDALDMYQKEKPDWIVFGNNYTHLNQLPENTQTALLYHGIGVKSCYFDANLMEMDIRFVEGDYRYRKLNRMYPKAKIESVGFAKLDPLLNDDKGKKVRFDLKKNQLDPSKPTLLYAPTFYPSSIELMPDDWPAHFDEYNLIIKPHFFSFSKKKYENQRLKISKWKSYKNTYIAEPEDYSLLPFMAVSDLLISEASSAFFEFAALDKPIVWCDFVKLRIGYKGIFRFRFKKRMDTDIEKYHDIGIHVSKYKSLKKAVDSQIRNPQQFSLKRKQYTKELIGETDGKISKRIVDYLISKTY